MGKTYTAPPIDKDLSTSVAEVVSKVMGVFTSDLFRKTRKQEVVRARQAYYFVMVKRFRCSPSSLERYHGHISGTDHSSVLHGVKTCSNDMDTDPEHRESMNKIFEKIDLYEEKIRLKKTGQKSYIKQFKWGRQNYQTRLLLRRTR